MFIACDLYFLLRISWFVVFANYFLFLFAAEAVLSASDQKKEIEAAEILQRKEDILAGKLVETGKGAAPSQSPHKSPYYCC